MTPINIKNKNVVGRIAELKVMEHLISKYGIIPSEEMTGTRPYDCIGELKNGKLIKIQIKARTNETGSITVVPKSFGNDYQLKYQMGDFDLYIVYVLGVKRKNLFLYISGYQLVAEESVTIRVSGLNRKIGRTPPKYYQDYMSLNKALLKNNEYC